MNEISVSHIRPKHMLCHVNMEVVNYKLKNTFKTCQNKFLKKNKNYSLI